jgi:hypothetical protein
MLNPETLATVRHFRQEVYGCLGHRQDSLFDLVDAVLSTPERSSLARLSLSPAFRRRWPSTCDALADGSLDTAGLRRLLVTALPELSGGRCSDGRPVAVPWAFRRRSWHHKCAGTGPRRR